MGRTVTTISDFDIFARVAKTGNMSAAGREMGVSPAVVSKRISVLEERLGARLFQRTTRQLTLTETGEGYHRRVLDILSRVAEADDYVSRRNTRPRGQLKVTAPTSFTRLQLAPHISRFVEQFPEIQLDFHLNDSFVDIIRDGYDVAIRVGELPDSSLVARKLCPDRRVICAAPSYLDRVGEPRTLADLERHNCLSASAQDAWRLEGPEGPCTVHIKGNLRSDSAELLRAALIAGIGLGFRSTWEIAPELASGALKPVLPAYRGSSQLAIYAVYPSRDFMPAKVNAFIEFMTRSSGNEPSRKRGVPADLSDAGADRRGSTNLMAKRSRSPRKTLAHPALR
jgi:DNA-binding transcriptional LysR family regulator